VSLQFSIPFAARFAINFRERKMIKTIADGEGREQT